MVKWWLLHGLIGAVIATGVWGAVLIAYDIVILANEGSDATISWETQQAALANPIIPMMWGFLLGGFTVHFFVVRTMAWYSSDQPWWYAVIGAVLGATLVALAWTQRG